MDGQPARRVWWPSAGLIALAALLGRAGVLGSAYPYAPALVPAAARAGFTRSTRLAAGAVAAASAALAVGALRALEVVVAVAVAETCLLFWRPRGATGLGLLAAACAAAAGMSRLAVAGLSEYHLAVWGFQTLLVGAAAPCFAAGLRLVDARVDRQRGDLPLGAEQMVCAGVLVGAAFSGLGGLRVGPVDAQQALGATAVLIGGAAAGAPVGAALGAAVGLSIGLSDGVSAALIGRLALAGLLAGAFSDLGRVGAMVGFLAGQVMAGYYVTPAERFGSVLWESGIAGAAAALTPSCWLAALGSVARGLHTDREHPDGGPKERIIRRLAHLSGVFTELARAFEQAAPAQEAATETDLPRIYGALSERVCHGCPLYRTCWEHDFYQTYNSLTDVWTQVELQGRVSPAALTGALRRRCVRQSELASTVNYLHDIVRLNRAWERRVREGREVVGAQLRGVAQIIQRLGADIDRSPPTEDRRAPGGGPKLHIRCGLARAAKAGNVVSGDSAAVRRLDAHQVMVALSDGMGAGPKAALESHAAVSLLGRLLQSGFDISAAIQAINSILLLRSAEERFATIDLLLIDLTAGTAQSVKIGAAPSFVRTGAGVEVIRSASLPVGILSQVRVDTSRRTLHPGDVIVMATDGLLGSPSDRDGEARVVEFLRQAPSTEPQALAEALLLKATDGRRGQPGDDVTVLAVAVQKASPGSEPVHVAAVAAREWVPAVRRGARPGEAERGGTAVWNVRRSGK